MQEDDSLLIAIINDSIYKLSVEQFPTIINVISIGEKIEAVTFLRKDVYLVLDSYLEVHEIFKDQVNMSLLKVLDISHSGI